MSEANETIPGAPPDRAGARSGLPNPKSRTLDFGRDPGSTSKSSQAGETISIAIETPLQDEVRALVCALNEYTYGLTPAEFRHHLTVEQMADASTTLFVARADGKAVAIGCLKRHPNQWGEVKRMFTAPEQRGKRLGGQILARIEQAARDEGLTRLVLETGTNFDAAKRVYERAGFLPCEPVLDYPPSPWTAFYAKTLTP